MVSSVAVVHARLPWGTGPDDDGVSIWKSYCRTLLQVRRCRLSSPPAQGALKTSITRTIPGKIGNEELLPHMIPLYTFMRTQARHPIRDLPNLPAARGKE